MSATSFNNLHFSSKKMDWATPWELFRAWDLSHGPFDYDVCATPQNAKCRKYFTPEMNGLLQSWYGICWMSPPYGREIGRWIAKAVGEVQVGNAERVVCLVPARTDTAWWHELVMRCGEIHFLRGRVRFEGAEHAAPFPSAIVVFG